MGRLQGARQRTERRDVQFRRQPVGRAWAFGHFEEQLRALPPGGGRLPRAGGVGESLGCVAGEAHRHQRQHEGAGKAAQQVAARNLRGALAPAGAVRLNLAAPS